MALAELFVLANLDVDGGRAPEPAVASLLVVPLPQAAGLQIGGLRASGAEVATREGTPGKQLCALAH